MRTIILQNFNVKQFVAQQKRQIGQSELMLLDLHFVILAEDRI
jgi:hypothetical protein